MEVVRRCLALQFDVCMPWRWNCRPCKWNCLTLKLTWMVVFGAAAWSMLDLSVGVVRLRNWNTTKKIQNLRTEPQNRTCAAKHTHTTELQNLVNVACEIYLHIVAVSSQCIQPAAIRAQSGQLAHLQKSVLSHRGGGSCFGLWVAGFGIDLCQMELQFELELEF